MAAAFNLISPGTRVTANGHGEPFDVRGSQSRTFLCTMDITEQIEQESLDVSIWGSADGQDFGKQPILKIPQRFYRGETRQILDRTTRPEIIFVRANWDLVRWGRVAPHPMFVIGLRLEEVSAFVRQPAVSRG
jgi:hypothetical protein